MATDAGIKLEKIRRLFIDAQLGQQHAFTPFIEALRDSLSHFQISLGWMQQFQELQLLGQSFAESEAIRANDELVAIYKDHSSLIDLFKEDPRVGHKLRSWCMKHTGMTNEHFALKRALLIGPSIPQKGYIGWVLSEDRIFIPVEIWNVEPLEDAFTIILRRPGKLVRPDGVIIDYRPYLHSTRSKARNLLDISISKTHFYLKTTVSGRVYKKHPPAPYTG